MSTNAGKSIVIFSTNILNMQLFYTFKKLSLKNVYSLLFLKIRGAMGPVLDAIFEEKAPDFIKCCCTHF